MVAAALFAAGLCASARAGSDKPFLHPLFTDNAVLQRDTPVNVWGWTTPGETVSVRIAGRSGSAVAGPDGKWTVRLKPVKAGGPYEMTVTGPKTVTLRNVMYGDVWVGSGQSNMEMAVSGVRNAAAEIAAADYPNIRLYDVPNTIALEPAETVSGEWKVCSPQTVGPFSAALFFFGRDLYKALGVPIGLLHSSWGGTVAQAWTSKATLQRDFPEFRDDLKNVEANAAMMKEGARKFAEEVEAWYEANDPGSKPGAGWQEANFDDSAWKTVTMPATYDAIGLADWDGIVWYRAEFNAPAGIAGKEATLRLGPIDDEDTTWVNGTAVGFTSKWDASRTYRIPAGVLKPGRNVIAVRVWDMAVVGGFGAAKGDMRLDFDGGSVSLDIPWRYRATTSLQDAKPRPQDITGNPNAVTVLYNGMIRPLQPYTIKGVIWYQGEANAPAAYQYRKLLPAMIADWRATWGQGDFPFYIVQLANWQAVKPEPGDDDWAELREAQSMTAATVRNCGIAVTIDIGEANDIHPKNKQDVGGRLALVALHDAYGKPVAYSGPVYKAMKVDGGRIVLTFSHTDAGLVAKGGPLKGFAIAGADRKFVWADAVIEGDKVVVSSPKVPNPVAVRYAWAINPECNLYNGAGLPASPFRTDDWPGITGGTR